MLRIAKREGNENPPEREVEALVFGTNQKPNRLSVIMFREWRGGKRVWPTRIGIGRDHRRAVHIAATMVREAF